MSNTSPTTADVESLFKTTMALHGHKCPGSATGLRAGLAAREALGVSQDANKELQCYVDTGPAGPAHCFIDGVQVGTGCTYGKGNIKKVKHGKSTLRLIDTETGRQVRVSLHSQWYGHALDNSSFIAQRKDGTKPMDIDNETTDSAVQQILTVEDDELLAVSEVEKTNVDDDQDRGSFYQEGCVESLDDD